MITRRSVVSESAAARSEIHVLIYLNGNKADIIIAMAPTPNIPKQINDIFDLLFFRSA